MLRTHWDKSTFSDAIRLSICCTRSEIICREQLIKWRESFTYTQVKWKCLRRWSHKAGISNSPLTRTKRRNEYKSIGQQNVTCKWFYQKLISLSFEIWPLILVDLPNAGVDQLSYQWWKKINLNWFVDFDRCGKSYKFYFSFIALFQK